jgi:hypothetical protein
MEKPQVLPKLAPFTDRSEKICGQPLQLGVSCSNSFSQRA